MLGRGVRFKVRVRQVGVLGSAQLWIAVARFGFVTVGLRFIWEFPPRLGS